MIVRVGTAGAMKVAAVRKAFGRYFRGLKVKGVDVPSGVDAEGLGMDLAATSSMISSRFDTRDAWRDE